MASTPPTAAIAYSARRRAACAEAIKRAWQDGRPPDAAAALRAHPELAADRAVALDLAYEEFCAREEAGEAVDADAFCARFPFGASLRRLLTVHQFLDAHPDALGTAPAAWPAAGDPVGDFQVLRELGRGSFARVYLAAETTAGHRPVVLKVSGPGSREADTLGRLAHPHLIQVLSCRAVGAWTVVAMPFAGTATLEDALEAVWPAGAARPRTAAALLGAAARGGRPDDPALLARPAPLFDERTGYADAIRRLAAGLFAAVAYLHARGVVHRDIKPSNVLLGPGGHPYLLDFNLASHGADPWRLVGTLPYMAPEQLALFAGAGAPPAGEPGDVFACGVVLFELLTGRHPFGARGAVPTGGGREAAAAALLAAQRAGHPDLRVLNPDVPRAVRAAVERCLAPDPARRPTAAEMAALLAPGAARGRRLRAAALVGAGVLVAALGSSVAREQPRVPAADPVPAAPAASAPSTPFERGMLLCEQKEYALAAGEFRAAVRTGDRRAAEWLVFCLSQGRAADGAVAAADEAVRFGAGTPAVYANRGYNHLKLGQYARAMDDCDEALRLDPELVAARYTRARAELLLRLASPGTKGGGIRPQTVADIDAVTAAAADDQEVWVTAAQIYILVADGRPELLDRAAAAVREAIRTGKAPGAVARNKLFAALANHPAYKDALARDPGPVTASDNPHIAKPRR